MRRSSIGGVLDLASLALLVGSHGRQHRHQDRETVRVAAVELRARGLTDRDIGQALGLAEQAVRELLGERP